MHCKAWKEGGAGPWQSWQAGTRRADVPSLVPPAPPAAHARLALPFHRPPSRMPLSPTPFHRPCPSRMPLACMPLACPPPPMPRLPRPPPVPFSPSPRRLPVSPLAHAPRRMMSASDQRAFKPAAPPSFARLTPAPAPAARCACPVQAVRMHPCAEASQRQAAAPPLVGECYGTRRRRRRPHDACRSMPAGEHPDGPAKPPPIGPRVETIACSSGVRGRELEGRAPVAAPSAEPLGLACRRRPLRRSALVGPSA